VTKTAGKLASREEDAKEGLTAAGGGQGGQLHVSAHAVRSWQGWPPKAEACSPAAWPQAPPPCTLHGTAAPCTNTHTTTSAHQQTQAAQGGWLPLPRITIKISSSSCRRRDHLAVLVSGSCTASQIKAQLGQAGDPGW